MPRLVETNNTPETGYDVVALPVPPALDHEHDLHQIGVEHHWLDEYNAYEAIPVMECKNPLCSYQEGRKAEFNHETGEYDLEHRIEWDDEVHTEYVVFPRDENGAHIR